MDRRVGRRCTEACTRICDRKACCHPHELWHSAVAEWGHGYQGGCDASLYHGIVEGDWWRLTTLNQRSVRAKHRRAPAPGLDVKVTRASCADDQHGRAWEGAE